MYSVLHEYLLYTLITQIQAIVKKDQLELLMALLNKKEELKCVLIKYGVVCVMMDGTRLMLM